MADKSEIQRLMEELSGKIEPEKHPNQVVGVDSEGGIDLDDPAVKEWRKRSLEQVAIRQGRIACCPNCNYIVPLTEMTCQAEYENLYCTICEKEFNENDAILEAKKYQGYEQLINKELESAGFNGRIFSLRRVRGKVMQFRWNTEFAEEMKSRKERILKIFLEIIPEKDRK